VVMAGGISRKQTSGSTDSHNDGCAFRVRITTDPLEPYLYRLVSATSADVGRLGGWA